MTNSSTTTDHLAPRPDKPPIVVGAALPRASAADAARTILGDGGIAALSTLMADGRGIPFGSVIAFATGARGDPTFCISELAEHTRNLHADPRASLLVTETRPNGADPLALGRVTLIGHAGPVPDAEQGAATELVVARHPAVAGYAGYGDFSCWRLDIDAVRWVGGFGRMDWIDVAAFRDATVDPVVAGRDAVIAHMNEDHADAGVLLCTEALASAGRSDVTVSAATFDAVDRFGCDYVAATSDGPAYIRLAFDEPARSLTAVRGAIVALVRRARSS